jgi:hypothetical protein
LEGTRKEEIPVHVADGKILLNIDTATLKNGPAPFFEIVETPAGK